MSALVSIAGKYSRVFGYDAGDASSPWEVYDVAVPAWANDLQLLRPGRGYWILATAAADLAIGNLGTELAVDIAQPAQLAEVTEPTAIVGSVQGQALARWELRYRSLEEGSGWVPLASGGTAQSNATLATFDPTVLLNGLYEIELSALDVSGGGVSLSTHVTVKGQQKIGNFTVSFVDLEIPLAGVPIQVVRTYDSREKRSTGITHSSGKSVSWTRDSAGRIATLTDPLGKSLAYTYDAAGDLQEVTDREDQATRFTYNAAHGLLTIEDPRGIQPLRNEYDAAGRLQRRVDAFGKTIELTHDLADHREVVTDRLGPSRTLGYL